MSSRWTPWLVAAAVAIVAACGGGGGGGGSSAPNITFATQLPGSVSLNSVKALAVTSIDQQADQRVSLRFVLDRFYAMVGIRSAYAAATPINGLFYFSGTSEFNRIDLLQVVDPVTGARSPLSDATLKATSTSQAPSITGFFTTPLYVIQSVKNLYKPNASGRVDRSDSSTACPLLAIQRSTGKVACINVLPWCEELSNCGNTFGNTSIQANGSGSVVYVQDKNQNLVKLDLSNIDDIVITQLTVVATDGHLQSLVVNKDGDAYVNLDTGVAFQNTYRIYKITGGSYSLNNTGLFSFVNCPFSGPAFLNDAAGNNDGNNFYFADESNRYWKVSKDAGATDGFSTPVRLGTNFSLPLTDGNNCKSLVKDGSFAHSAADPGAYSNADPTLHPNFVTELASPGIVQGTATPRNIDFSSRLTKVHDLYSYPGYLIVWGKDAQDKDVLVKYTKTNGGTGAMTTFFNAASGYTLQSLTVSSLGEVTAAVVDAVTGNSYLSTINAAALNSVTRGKQLDATLVQVVAPN